MELDRDWVRDWIILETSGNGCNKRTLSNSFANGLDVFCILALTFANGLGMFLCDIVPRWIHWNVASGCSHLREDIHSDSESFPRMELRNQSM